MIFSVLTLFPEMFRGPFSASIVKRAQVNGHVTINLINIRDFASDRYRTVDDRPYGGGVGMVLKVDVIDRALTFAKNQYPQHIPTSILLDPKGETYTQIKALSLTDSLHLILICGHYEGVDARVVKLVDQVISIGDYIVTGGEIPAMVIVDSIVRLLPGVLPKEAATAEESFSNRTLEYPHYTRPARYKDMRVPQILLSGNKERITQWRIKKAKSLTKTKLKPAAMTSRLK